MKRLILSRQKQQGFSLLEVLITVAVIATGVIALAKFQGNLFTNSYLAKNRVIAMNMAENQVDTLRGTPYANLASGTSTLTPDVTGLTETYTVNWTVAPPDPVNNPTLNTDITVVVTWNDRDGTVTNDTTVTLNSRISDSPEELSAMLQTASSVDMTFGAP